MEPLLEAWRINDRINRYLLAAIPAEVLGTTLAKGKSVRANFAHIHNVRLMWIKASAPELCVGLEKLDDKSQPTREQIAVSLEASGKVIERLLERAGSPEARIKGFKPHAAAFLAYLVAHESYHRAMTEIALRQAGTPLPEKESYGAWEWGVR